MVQPVFTILMVSYINPLILSGNIHQYPIISEYIDSMFPF
jgi:hypothetical protein